MTDDLEQIKQYYADFDDSKIVHLAENEAEGLRPEVIPVLMEEIKKRGLDIELFQMIEYQIKPLKEEELNELKQKIIHLPCPDCNERSTPLVGSLIRTVIGMITSTSYTKESVITCPSCAKNRRKYALISTLLLGWWGIPFGPVKTPVALISMLTDRDKREETSETIITSLVCNHIAKLRAIHDNEEELVEYIRHINDD